MGLLFNKKNVKKTMSVVEYVDFTEAAAALLLLVMF